MRAGRGTSLGSHLELDNLLEVGPPPPSRLRTFQPLPGRHVSYPYWAHGIMVYLCLTEGGDVHSYGVCQAAACIEMYMYIHVFAHVV